MLPFRIKICGVTSVENALECARAGAEAIGLNFHPASKRYVEPPTAREIVAALPTGVTAVAVVVNQSPKRIVKLAQETGIEWVQLHGDESPELLAEIAPRLQVILARRLASWDLLARELEACRDAGRLPQAVLVDAIAPGHYGGSGQVADWQGFVSRQGELAKVPLVLAGGLTAMNVAAAIGVVSPQGVDAASGVESAPGVKDPELVRQFVMAARSGWEQKSPTSEI